MQLSEPIFSQAERVAVEALLDEHVQRAGRQLQEATSEIQVDLDCIAESVRRWTPLAEAETTAHRPHQIAIGLLLLRAKSLFSQLSAN